MLAVNAAVFAGVFLQKIALPPYVPYIHLLVDYHFGFTKRALIGAAVAVFTDKVPVWLVFALAGRYLADHACTVRNDSFSAHSASRRKTCRCSSSSRARRSS